MLLIGAALIVIASGLALRLLGYQAGLPFIIVKYGGSILWGSMVYCLVASILPRRTVWTVATLSLCASAAVEVFRLFHTPWLDAFRLSLAGALLLGRVFSVMNIFAYAIGIGLAAGLDQIVARAQIGSTQNRRRELSRPQTSRSI